MNSQTAGNSVTVFPAESSAALCLFIRCFSLRLAAAADMPGEATEALNL